MGFGLGLYFGFEPGTRQLASWLKKSPTQAAKIRSQSKLVNADEGVLPNAESDKPGWVLNRDSTQMVLNCPTGELRACLQAIDSARAGLASWLLEAMARRMVNANTATWSVTCRFPLDSGLSDPNLASLIRLSVGVGSGKKVFLPRLRSQGWTLCPESGCDEKSQPRFPIAEAGLVRIDKDKACLRAEGLTALLAPEAGWVARRDTIAGQLRLVLDHDAFGRSVFTGDMVLSPDLKPGKRVNQGQRLGQTQQAESSITVLWLAQGSPTLPPSWQVASAPEAEEHVP